MDRNKIRHSCGSAHSSPPFLCSLLPQGVHGGLLISLRSHQGVLFNRWVSNSHPLLRPQGFMGMLRMAVLLEIWVPHRSDNTPLRRIHAEKQSTRKQPHPLGSVTDWLLSLWESDTLHRNVLQRVIRQNLSQDLHLHNSAQHYVE